MFNFPCACSTHHSLTHYSLIKSMEFKSDQHIGSFSSYSPSSSSSASQSNPNSPSSPPPLSSLKRKGGRKKFKETRHPVYRGVRQRNGNKWVCEIREPNKKSRIWLGTYPTPEMAAVAHDVAALALRREMSVLNFPESARRIPQARSCSAKDICIAAQEAAKAFQPSVTSYSSSSARVQEEVVLEAVSSVEEVSFWDEEAFFNMPGLLNSLAEGLLLTPPAMERGFSWDDVDSVSFDHFSLWSI